MDLVPYPGGGHRAASRTTGEPTGRFAVVGHRRRPGWLPAGQRGDARPPPSSTGRSPRRTRATPSCSSSGSCRGLSRRRSWTDLQALGAPDQVVTRDREAEQAAPVQRGLDVQATALRVFALLVVVLSLLLAFQALRRRMADDTADDPVWQALGVDARCELRRSRVAIGALTAPIAAVAAVLTAVALSPLFPLGVGRDLELDAGVRADGRYLIVGVLVVPAHRDRAPRGRRGVAGPSRCRRPAPPAPACLAPLLGLVARPHDGGDGDEHGGGRPVAGPGRSRCGRRS